MIPQSDLRRLLATKADITAVKAYIDALRQETAASIEALRQGTRTSIEAVKADLLKRLFGAPIAQGRLIVTLVKLL